jgi:trans-2,3-dihydro-3-hydroxyanthranilate isomerase
MKTVPFALYDAFSDTAFGGSQAGVVTEAAWLDADARGRIAKEVGAPATGFVTTCSERAISAHFHSTVTEYPMCGHGTICLMTRLLELGVISWNGSTRIDVELKLPDATATVEISRREDNRAMVMLDIQPPSFRQDTVDLEELTGLLGLSKQDYRHEYPIETAVADFVHLVVPVKNLAAMRRIDPDFTGLTRFWHDHDIQTVAVFCTEVEQSDHNLHVRDFCPAVGVPESAAAGTTNSALTSYLVRHEIVRPNGDGQIVLQAEQGYEIGRPSSIRSEVYMSGNSITRLQVGGVATRVMDGQLHLPFVP